jgi:hypothetical protein
MHLVDLLSQKIEKILVHLATRGLRGEHVKLLSREVLWNMLQHVHRMIAWMTFVKPWTRAKKITISEASKKGGGWRKEGVVKMAISKAQGAKKVSWPLIQPLTTFFPIIATV